MTLRLACTSVAALLLLAAAGCRDSAPARIDRYTVRGEIARMPARQGDELSIRHEAIPAFKEKGGAVVGMEAMVMGFAVGKELSLAGLSPGDKVELTFTVNWARPALAIERLEKLPPGTALDFGKAAAR